MAIDTEVIAYPLRIKGTGKKICGDSYFIGRNIFAVCDGHSDKNDSISSDYAAAQSVKHVEAVLQEAGLDHGTVPESTIIDALQKTVGEVHQGMDNNLRVPAASTIDLLVIHQGKAYLQHLGDGEVYAFKNNTLERWAGQEINDSEERQRLTKEDHGPDTYLGKEYLNNLEMGPPQSFSLEGVEYIIMVTDGVYKRMVRNDIQSVIMKNKKEVSKIIAELEKNIVLSKTYLDVGVRGFTPNFPRADYLNQEYEVLLEKRGAPEEAILELAEKNPQVRRMVEEYVQKKPRDDATVLLLQVRESSDSRRIIGTQQAPIYASLKKFLEELFDREKPQGDVLNAYRKILPEIRDHLVLEEVITKFMSEGMASGTKDDMLRLQTALKSGAGIKIEDYKDDTVRFIVQKINYLAGRELEQTNKITRMENEVRNSKSTPGKEPKEEPKAAEQWNADSLTDGEANKISNRLGLDSLRQEVKKWSENYASLVSKVTGLEDTVKTPLNAAKESIAELSRLADRKFMGIGALVLASVAGLYVFPPHFRVTVERDNSKKEEVQSKASEAPELDKYINSRLDSLMKEKENELDKTINEKTGEAIKKGLDRASAAARAKVKEGNIISEKPRYRNLSEMLQSLFPNYPPIACGKQYILSNWGNDTAFNMLRKDKPTNDETVKDPGLKPCVPLSYPLGKSMIEEGFEPCMLNSKMNQSDIEEIHTALKSFDCK